MGYRKAECFGGLRTHAVIFRFRDRNGVGPSEVVVATAAQGRRRRWRKRWPAQNRPAGSMPDGAAARIPPQWDAIDAWRASLSSHRLQALNNPREVCAAYLEYRRDFGDPETKRARLAPKLAPNFLLQIGNDRYDPRCQSVLCADRYFPERPGTDWCVKNRLRCAALLGERSVFWAAPAAWVFATA
jgi:hypothetical protein